MGAACAEARRLWTDTISLLQRDRRVRATSSRSVAYLEKVVIGVEMTVKRSKTKAGMRSIVASEVDLRATIVFKEQEAPETEERLPGGN